MSDILGATQKYIPPPHVAHLFPPAGMLPARISHWRVSDLYQQLRSRDGNCWNCDGGLVTYIHEVVTRGNVMGWQPKTRRLAIFNGLNSIILCPRCHNTEHEPKASVVFDWMAEQYGENTVAEWLQSLRFRGPHPVQGWLRERSK